MQFQNKKVLIIDKMHSSISAMLSEIGLEADYRPEISREEIFSIIADYRVIFVRSKISVDEVLLSAAKNLKVIGRAGAGIDQLDMAAIEKRGIVVINAPEGNRDAVAEQAVGMLLALMNKLLQADAQVRSGIWDREGNRGIELMEKTVGIIGFGYMGQAFAKRLKGFGCNILAYDKYKNGFGGEGVKESSLEEIWQEADVLSLHIPLTAETRSMVNHAFLSRFRKEIIIINTARGEILPLHDLRLALENGKVKGVALDVLENEKLQHLTPSQKQNFDYLVKSQKVIFTPHVAGWTHESYVKINRTLVDKLKKLMT